MKKYIFLIITLLWSFVGFGQFKKASVDEISKNWKWSLSKKVVQPGEEVMLQISFSSINPWYVYGVKTDCEVGPNMTVLEIKNSQVQIGKLKAIHAKYFNDELIFGCSYEKFSEGGNVAFEVPIKFKGKSGDKIKFDAVLMFQSCSESTCLEFTKSSNLEVTLAGETIKTDGLKEPTDNTTLIEEGNEDTVKVAISNIENNNGSGDCLVERRAGFDDIKVIPFQENVVASQDFSSYLEFFILCFLAGLTALLTPCVFPLIPMTVTFFTKKSEKGGKSQALIYGVSIIAIYLIIALVVSKVNGPGFANWISTHPIPNMFFFLIFLVFALSFLGLFEITLPSSLVNKMDAQADKGGLIGIFFMAFTLVLVSFSCTGPIVGSILILSAGGSWVKPIIGMTGYALAFALPFTLFALFPSALQKLPKSGGWLNVVKVSLGLLELAFALKFLSQADLIQGWGILDREVFLVLWIAIFLVLAYYLFGRIRFPHDSHVESVGVFRALAGIASLAFAIYMIPGLWGAPLKSLSGMLPPEYTQDFILKSDAKQEVGGNLCETPMYADQLHLPHGLVGYYDIRQAICCAQKLNKPIFVDFTGHGCANCRLMESNVWSDERVLKKLREDYVILALYGDDKKIQIAQNEKFVNKLGEKVETLGDYNTTFLTEKFNKQGQPYYLILDAKTDTQTKITTLTELASSRGYDPNIEKFLKFLK